MIRAAAILLALAGTAAAQTKTETHGNITFRVPEGYQLTRGQDGIARLRRDEAEKWLELRLLPGVKLAGKVEDHVDRLLKDVEKNNPTEFVVDTARTSKRPKNAERICYAGASAINPNAPGTYSHFLIWCYRTGGRVETIVINSNSPALYNAQQKTLDKLLNDMRFASAKVIAEGTPPLTEFAYDRTISFVEWLLEVPMTAMQRTTIREAMVAAWQKNDRETIDGTQELIDGVDELAAKTDDEKRALRVIVRDKALAEWRKSKDPVEQMLVGVWDAAHQPLVPGTPPLTQQVCDATAEAYFLMACAVAGQGMRSPDKALLAKWTELLRTRYPDLPQEFRVGLQQMPVFAAAMRVGWADMPEAEKTQLVAQWKTVPGVVELGKQLAAASAQSLLDLQARMQANNMYFQTMSNIMRMQHETSMTIINNMGGGGWRYEYRWR